MLGFCRRRINNRFDFGNPIRWKASLFGMLAHGRLIRGDIHAIDFVIGYIAFEPLDLWSQFPKDTARFLRDSLQLIRCELSGSRDFTFDYVFWHILFW